VSQQKSAAVEVIPHTGDAAVKPTKSSKSSRHFPDGAGAAV